MWSANTVNCPSIHQYSRVLVKCIIKQQLNGSFKYNELSFLSLFLSFLFLFLLFLLLPFHSLRYFIFSFLTFLLEKREVNNRVGFFVISLFFISVLVTLFSQCIRASRIKKKNNFTGIAVWSIAHLRSWYSI